MQLYQNRAGLCNHHTTAAIEAYHGTLKVNPHIWTFPTKLFLKCQVPVVRIHKVVNYDFASLACAGKSDQPTEGAAHWQAAGLAGRKAPG